MQDVLDEKYYERLNNMLDKDLEETNERLKRSRNSHNTESAKEKAHQKTMLLISEQQKNKKIKKIAKKIITDRTALLNTIDFLAQKWIPESQKERALIEAQNFREQDADRIAKEVASDKQRSEKLDNMLENKSDSFSPQRGNQIQKRKRKSKPKL